MRAAQSDEPQHVSLRTENCQVAGAVEKPVHPVNPRLSRRQEPLLCVLSGVRTRSSRSTAPIIPTFHLDSCFRRKHEILENPSDLDHDLLQFVPLVETH